MKRFIPALRWTARGLALVVFVLWGLFFVEHLIEWFIKPFPRFPPAWVVAGQILHFLMLAGLLMVWRWELAGSLLVIGTAFLFFVDKTGSRFPLFFGLTVLPAVLLLICWWTDRRARSGVRLTDRR